MSIVLVTGATSGFGAAITRRFARDSHRVIAAGRRAERLERLRQELGPALLPLRLLMSTTCPGLPPSPAACRRAGAPSTFW